MKKIIFLSLLIITFGVYIIISHQGGDEYPAKKESCRITVEKVDNTHYMIPPVKEINYFETGKNINNWHVSADEKGKIIINRLKNRISQGECSMEVKWNTSEWAELILTHFPEDWQHYSSLLFDVFNPGDEKLEMEIKIGDWYDVTGYYYYKKKYSEKSDLKTGWNTFKLNITDIAKQINILSERKVIFLRAFSKNSIFYVDNMRLEL